MIEDFDIFDIEGLFFLNTLLKISRPGICSSVLFVLIVINLEVVTRKFLSPADLSRAQRLHINELTKVFVVSKDEKLMFANF